LELALRQLQGPPAGIVGESPVAAKILQGSRMLARLARGLALRGGRCQAEQALCAGLLAPLGWLAVCAVSADAAAACLADPAFRTDPAATQRRHWGVDHPSLARRLALGFCLPGWLSGVLGWLDLPTGYAQRFGAPPELFACVRLAVHLAREHGCDLGLACGVNNVEQEEAIAGVRLCGLPVEEFLAEDPAWPVLNWDNPYQEPLLRQLLAVAIDNRRLRQVPVVTQLQRELDDLHTALREQVLSEAARLQAAKLSALAEFSSGAGHEINNPLAVISGQAQYLLYHEDDLFAGDTEGTTRKALNTIIGQTKRIHCLLRDLMQFARPVPPRPTWIDLPTLMGEVAASLAGAAAGKRLRLEVSARPERLAVLVDGEQLRTALVCLVRNAIEAAPTEGWARLILADSPEGAIQVVVEDSGSGPSAEQVPHLFDPFYSGKSAGRGRGLGLPVAWRLARHQGGDLHLEPPRPGTPTRFVLTLPRCPSPVPLAIGRGEEGPQERQAA
jgi:signal transduction histidine kinase